MKELKTKNLKIKFLGAIPVFQENGEIILNPQEVVSLSALFTFKGKSVKKLFEESKAKGEDLGKKIKNILQKSSLRGHASMATTPSLAFTYEASKFFDSALTPVVFSSSLMASGRRTDTCEEDIIFPMSIDANPKAKEIYRKTSAALIGAFNEILKEGCPKDEVSKLLQYGIYGTGIIQLSVESLALIKREYESEKEWMPEDIGFFLSSIEKELHAAGLDWLYATRLAAPRGMYPYPNIFKNPEKTNLARELCKKYKVREKGPAAVFFRSLPAEGFKKRLDELKKEINRCFSENSGKGWYGLMAKYQHLYRDYNGLCEIGIVSAMPWRIWGEKKRHRTVKMVSESIYICVRRAAEIFEKARADFRKNLKKIETQFSVPVSIKNNPIFLRKYLGAAASAFKSYKTLISMGIPERDAVFLIPRGLRVDIYQEYDLYNLGAGYYPLRLCSTAEEELRRTTLQEAEIIRRELSKNGLDWLAFILEPKCAAVGFCPEEKTCNYVKKIMPEYNEAMHLAKKDQLKQMFEENLKHLGKNSQETQLPISNKSK